MAGEDTNGQASMNLGMQDSVSLDMRDLMADQLTEIKAMREEIEKSNKGTLDGTMIPAEENPYIMNPYYTEHHDDAVNIAMSQVNRAHETKEKEGIFGTLSDYANETGYGKTWLGDKMIDGRGVTSKEADLAGMQFRDNIVNGTLGKLDPFLQGAGDLGAGAVVGSLFGGPVGFGVGIAAGAATAYGVREGIDEIESYQNYRNTIYDRSDSFINDAEASDNSGGFTKRESRQAARKLTSMNSKFGISDEEMSEIFQGSLDNDLLSSVSNVDEFAEKMSALVDTVKTNAKTLGMTLTEVTSMMGELEREGIGLGAQDYVMSSASQVAASLNMSNGEFIGDVANRVGNLADGSTADADAIAATVVAGSSYMGKLKDFANSSENLSEQSANSILNNDLSTGDLISILESSSGNKTIGSLVMGASMVEAKDGSWEIDQSKFEKNINKFTEDGIDGMDSLNADIDVVQNKLKDKFDTEFESATLNFTKEKQTEYAIGLSDIAYKKAVDLGLANDERDLTMDDFNKMSDAEKDTIIKAGSIGMDGDKALFAAQFSLWSDEDTVQYSAASNMLKNAAAKTNGDNQKLRMLSPSAWAAGEVVNVPEYLKDYEVNENYDYENLSGDKLAFVTGQVGKTMDAIMYGEMDTNMAYYYSGKAKLNGTLFDSDKKAIQRDIGVFAEAIQGEGLDSQMATYIRNVGGESMFEDLEDAHESGNKDDFYDIAAELLTTTESSLKNGEKKSISMTEGITEKAAEEVQSAQNKNNKAIETLLDSLTKGWLHNTDQIMEFVDIMNE